VALTANYCPGESFESIDERLLETASSSPKTSALKFVGRFVPVSVGTAVLSAIGADLAQPLAHLPRETRRRIARAMVEWPLPINGTRGYNFAEVTAGGVALDEVDPSTMESRVCPGLFLVGEILDVDGRLARYERLALHAPAYQAGNAAVAVAAAEAAVGAPLDADAVRGALARIRFPGRFEVVRERPALVLDGAHNPQAASVLASAIDDAFPTARPVVVLGVLSDKDAEGIIGALAPVADRFVVTRPASARALPAAELAAEVRRVTGVAPVVEPDVRRALETARELAGERGVVVTGSLYTVGEARGIMRRRPSS
jgi:hypothetical protein